MASVIADQEAGIQREFHAKFVVLKTAAFKAAVQVTLNLPLTAPQRHDHDGQL